VSRGWLHTIPAFPKGSGRRGQGYEISAGHTADSKRTLVLPPTDFCRRYSSRVSPVRRNRDEAGVIAIESTAACLASGRIPYEVIYRYWQPTLKTDNRK